MSVTGPDGVEWVTVAEALERVPGLAYRTLQSWWARGDVRTQRVGRQVWVAWDDVLDRDSIAIRTGYRPGRHASPTSLDTAPHVLHPGCQ